MVSTMSGKVVPNASPIAKNKYNQAIKTLKEVLPEGLHIYPFGSAGKKEISGDIDLLIDSADLLSIFPSTAVKLSRKLLEEYFKSKGLFSARTGVSVHVGIQVDDDIIQVDLMTVENASTIAYLHDHNYDDSSVTGKTIVSIWCDLANLTSGNLMISPYKGLLTRDKRTLISNDPYEIAKIIISPTATEYDMRSPSRLLKGVIHDPIKTQHIKNTYNI